MFDHVDAYPGDPILSLNEDFQKDSRPNKINLSIGIYFDDAGKLPVMASVREAEKQIAIEAGARPYLPMSGIPEYCDAVKDLVFGHAVQNSRVAVLQTIGASGALKVGSDFLKRYFPDSMVWISDPSWENHRVVFEGSGFVVNTYPYYDPVTGGLQFDKMVETLKTLPPRSIVLLHACCHNPTGVDLTREQWQALIPVFLKRQLVAFVDMAYQGFGDDVEGDAFAGRALAAGGVTTLVANSFSKNFSLYGERCGGLSVVCSSVDERNRVFGQLMATVRANYSNPPTHGAKVIAGVLNDEKLYAEWHTELQAMRNRIREMRRAIRDGLAERTQGLDLSRYLNQRGMFTFTGLNTVQVDRLRDEYGVYLLRSGRMCVAGLNERNVSPVASAIANVLAQSN
ncbi:MAG: amino acid aminotransferase [Devosia sp.]